MVCYQLHPFIRLFRVSDRARNTCLGMPEYYGVYPERSKPVISNRYVLRLCYFVRCFIFPSHLSTVEKR
jgi:hypothetical protein